MNKIIVIVGPTGVGKTKLSIELAKKLNGEIINADSTQVYRNLNIATAKVKKEEMQNIKHHLLDIKDITEEYTVYDFQKDCRNKIIEIYNNKKNPIIVGGTGLYVKAALYNYDFKTSSNLNLYENINTRELYEKLLEIDTKTPIHPNNRNRIVRALNYYNEFNRPMSSKEKSDKLLYDVIFIGLTTDRNLLYEKINERVDNMFENGLLDEAKKLYDSGIRTKAIMTPIGYKELFECFDGKHSISETIETIKKRSRNYAKRQYTWFNNQMPVTWFEVDYSNFDNTINTVLNYINNNTFN